MFGHPAELLAGPAHFGKLRPDSVIIFWGDQVASISQDSFHAVSNWGDRTFDPHSIKCKAHECDPWPLPPQCCVQEPDGCLVRGAELVRGSSHWTSSSSTLQLLGFSQSNQLTCFSTCSAGHPCTCLMRLSSKLAARVGVKVHVGRAAVALGRAQAGLGVLLLQLLLLEATWLGPGEGLRWLLQVNRCNEKRIQGVLWKCSNSCFFLIWSVLVF